MAASAGGAASPVVYELQYGPPEQGRLTLSGDRLTEFAVNFPGYSGDCSKASGGDTVFYGVFLGSVAVRHGSFAFHGQARGENGGGAQFSVQGTVSDADRVVSGRAAMTDGHTSTLSGCAYAFRFLGLPLSAFSDTLPSQQRTFASTSISFNYAAGIVSNLAVRASFTCRQASGVQAGDTANVSADLYGFSAIRASADGAWHLHADVFDEYEQIVVLTMTGRVGKNDASGTYTIAEPPGIVGSVGKCAGNYRWQARRQPVVSPPSSDGAAEDLAREAQVAADLYAADNSGTYVQLSLAALHEYNPRIPVTTGGGKPYISVVIPGRTSFTVTVTATSGHTFTITRTGSAIARTCTPSSGNNGGCHNGSW